MCSLEVHIVDNSNISKESFGTKAFHLNPKGSGKVAINFIKKMKNLQKRERWRTVSPVNYLMKGQFDQFLEKFEIGILIGDFISEIWNKYLKVFCESYNPKSLTKNFTCFKNYD